MIKNRHILTLIFIGLVVFTPPANAIVDTFIEDFETSEEGATIDDVNKWEVASGAESDCISQDDVTTSGGGKSVMIKGDSDIVQLSREDEYGGLTPCWVEYTIRAGLGRERRGAPTTGIGCVTFDHTGAILVADGSSWKDTGLTFSDEAWYKVIFQVNFKNHTYDAYIYPADTQKLPFLPDADSLEFIDPTIDTLSSLKFYGTYNQKDTSNSYVDDIVVHFIEKLAFITTPQVLTQNSPSGVITVQIQNNNSSPQTTPTDMTIELSTDSSKGTFSTIQDIDKWSPVTQVVITDGAQQVSFYYKDENVGTPIILAREYPDHNQEDALQMFEVVEDVEEFDIEVESPQKAGEAFQVTITSRNEDSSVNTQYAGSVSVTAVYTDPETGTKVLTPTELTGFEAGILKTDIIYPDAGIIRIKVMDVDESEMQGVSGPILFMPDKFVIDAETIYTVNAPWDLIVTALNKLEKETPNFNRKVNLSVITVDPEEVANEIITPPNIPEENQWDDGVATVIAKYNRWGTMQVEVRDDEFPLVKGVSDNIHFKPASMTIAADSPPGDREFYYAGESIGITVTMADADGAAVNNFEGEFEIDTAQALGLDPDEVFELADAGKKILTARSSETGTFTITVAHPAYELQAISDEIVVRQATLEVISDASPIGSTEVEIVIKDEDGQIITSENNLTIQIIVHEEFDDDSTFSSAVFNPVRFVNGVARIDLTDSQSEIVEVIPVSTYDFKIKKGTVAFGKIAKTGLGTLMMREVEDDEFE